MALDPEKIIRKRRENLETIADAIIATTIGHAFLNILRSGGTPTVDSIIAHFRDEISKCDTASGEAALTEAALRYLEEKTRQHEQKEP